MSYFKIKSPAKINLALNIVGKAKSLHKIESIISFLDLHDEIYIKNTNNSKHEIKFTGKFSKGIKLNNTVSKLLKNIDKKKLLKNKFKILIKKNIPLEAGLGGGSMNAANILNFLIKKKLIRIRKKEIIELAYSIGSDVILGLYSKNIILQSNNSIKTNLIKRRFYTLIVKPNYGCSTKNIYSKVKKFSKPEFHNLTKNIYNSKILREMKNDLEPIVLNIHPKLNDLKNFLEKLSNIEFARMTGSGSAIIGYFNSAKMCQEAEKKINKKYKNFWCKISKTI
tara:strand:+ start:141 stop:983 length:843 start_codon:yes stop_codon:yes gene_type:complete